MEKEVYSWRVSTEIKTGLEREARFRKTSVATILNVAVTDWLKRSRSGEGDEKEQRDLHAAAEKCLGAFEGRNPRRAETARELIRNRLRRRNGR